ncbi:hypothetical protein [Propionivibrio dicarboxylicus]|uniref:ABC transmembrane type-1 domain-containing protein n=1 Tax=Propionivibrio dicarboxylicus TaxID=83767 RepID=A0A1G8IEY7_9RHOO|nr:hypothetical protein [Propionivibrio dicarboxylicus]SDI17589.1 hypothetical protein SAMN05660652_02976 [Propionivibrio dicarboxylicus]
MSNVFALVMPFFAMNVYDRVVPNNATDTLWALGVALAVVMDFTIRVMRGHFIDLADARIDLELSAILMGRILGLRMEKRHIGRRLCCESSLVRLRSGFHRIFFCRHLRHRRLRRRPRSRCRPNYRCQGRRPRHQRQCGDWNHNTKPRHPPIATISVDTVTSDTGLRNDIRLGFRINFNHRDQFNTGRRTQPDLLNTQNE